MLPALSYERKSQGFLPGHVRAESHVVEVFDEPGHVDQDIDENVLEVLLGFLPRDAFPPFGTA